MATSGRNPVPSNPGRRGRPPAGMVRRSAASPARPTRGNRGRSLYPGAVVVRRRAVIQPTRFRLILVWGVLILAMLGLLGNLFRLQLLDADFLTEQALKQQLTNIRPFVPRRSVVDRTGNVMAIDRPVFTLYAHPILFDRDAQEIATALSDLLNRSPRQLLQAFQTGDSGIEIIYALSEDTAEQVRQLNLNGLELVSHQQRFYPQRDLFANVIGFVDVDQNGQAGIELSHQDELQRPMQEMQVSKTGDGAILPDHMAPDWVHADDLRLQLSLDSRLQRITRTTLQQKLQEYGAKRGAALVMDVQDGSILTLVTEPTYDPNRYNKANFQLFRNWALSDLYEPGSTFKPINVAIALDEGTIDPDEVFYDEGEIIVNGWPIRNFDYNERGGRGSQSVTDIITHSSNVGMVHIMQTLEPERYYDWLEKLDIDQPTHIDLPGETAGQLKEREQFVSARVESATTAFGQGFSLTPIKLIQLHAAIANGGRLVTPHVVRGLVDAEGHLVRPLTVPPPRPVFTPATARTVLSMMESVVTDGTAAVAQIPGYRVAGKTGTAQKADPQGGYMDQARITSFISVFPVDQPRYVVLVVVDEPQGDDAYGSTVAAPIARVLMESVIAIEKIPPTAPPSVIPDPSASP